MEIQNYVFTLHFLLSSCSAISSLQFTSIFILSTTNLSLHCVFLLLQPVPLSPQLSYSWVNTAKAAIFPECIDLKCSVSVFGHLFFFPSVCKRANQLIDWLQERLNEWINEWMANWLFSCIGSATVGFSVYFSTSTLAYIFFFCAKQADLVLWLFIAFCSSICLSCYWSGCLCIKETARYLGKCTSLFSFLFLDEYTATVLVQSAATVREPICAISF